MTKNLGKILWERIQTPQGHAFISDSLTEGWTDEEVLALAKNALAWEKECVKILKRFIKEFEDV